MRVNVKINVNSQHRGKPGILDNHITGNFIRIVTDFEPNKITSPCFVSLKDNILATSIILTAEEISIHKKASPMVKLFYV